MERRNGRNNAKTRVGKKGDGRKQERWNGLRDSVKIAKRVRRAGNAVISLKFGEQR